MFKVTRPHNDRYILWVDNTKKTLHLKNFVSVIDVILFYL